MLSSSESLVTVSRLRKDSVLMIGEDEIELLELQVLPLMQFGPILGGLILIYKRMFSMLIWTFCGI